tara:strand:+ start:107 stop:784 length:678 start_codon:yes stop_codon:yes gene_type:complete
MSEKHDDDVHLEEVYAKSEEFFEKNKKQLGIGIGAVVVVIAAVFYYFNVYLPPLEIEAQNSIYKAQGYFEADSFQLAMNGDNQGSLGFYDIVDQYGSTAAGNLAKYYLGVSLLRTGQYEDAIAYFDAYDAKDQMTAAISLGATGDAYAELQNTEKALDFYVKAANANDNEFTTPIYLLKAGTLAETLGDYNDALKYYKRIQSDYPLTQEGRSIKKYIARAEGFAK